MDLFPVYRDYAEYMDTCPTTNGWIWPFHSNHLWQSLIDPYNMQSDPFRDALLFQEGRKANGSVENFVRMWDVGLRILDCPEGEPLARIFDF